MIRCSALLTVVAGLAAVVLASPAAADEGPKVRAVLFWDSSCPNCETVINDVLPVIQARYGSQLEIVRGEISWLKAFDTYMLAIDHFGIPQERQGVPLLVIGDQVLLGADEIAERLEPAIEQGLANGGVDLLPALTLTEEDVQTLQSESAATITANASGGAPPDTSTTVEDPVATSAALAVLLFIVVALAYALATVWRAASAGTAVGRPAHASGAPAWVALLSVAGLFVAGYLSYVKLAGSGTICPIGHCEAVQHSAYAALLGIPVAYLGLLTYVVLVGLWLVARHGRGRWRGMGVLGIAGVSLFGTVFSAYLTYLEIAVIQAVCIWCLASAVIMALILIVAVPAAIAQAGSGAERTAVLATQ